MSSCGAGGCSCGSDCKCGSGCGCGRSGMYTETTTTTETIISGVAPVNMQYERSEMSFGAENGCKCGANCTCDPCTCK